MGNYRFKLSDMIPNAWFFKLKDMRKPNSSSTTKKKQSSSTTSSSSPQKQPKTDQPHNSHPRKSYYFTRDRDHVVIPSLDNLRISPGPSPSPSPLSRPHYPSPPRKSSKQRRTKRKSKGTSPRIVTSTVSAGCSCRATATVDSVWSKHDSPTAFSSLSASESTDSELSPPSPIHEFRADPNLGIHSFDKMVSWSTSCQCKAIDSNASDKSPSVSRKTMSFDSIEYDLVPEIELPQIVTKPVRFTDMVQSLKTKDGSVKPKSLSVKVVEQESIKVKEQSKTSSSSSSNSSNTTTTTTTTTTTSTKSSNRRFSVSSPSTRVKINSPRLGSRRNQGRKSVSSSSTSSSSSKSTSRRSLSVSDSFAVVKSSFDPQRDFRESMVEMIVQNNIKGPKELEDLLACYLSLNSDEYHELIIKVFKQIWFDLCDFQLN